MENIFPIFNLFLNILTVEGKCASGSNNKHINDNARLIFLSVFFFAFSFQSSPTGENRKMLTNDWVYMDCIYVTLRSYGGRKGEERYARENIFSRSHLTSYSMEKMVINK